MELSQTAGRYRESGSWWDSTGGSGVLAGEITVEFADNGLTFRTDEGHQMIVSLTNASPRGEVYGSGGDAASTGWALVGNRVLILEYTAIVRGREERNTDVWTFAGDIPQRAGVIRQPDRTIWFDTLMTRLD